MPMAYASIAAAPSLKSRTDRPGPGHPAQRQSLPAAKHATFDRSGGDEDCRLPYARDVSRRREGAGERGSAEAHHLADGGDGHPQRAQLEGCGSVKGCRSVLSSSPCPA